MIGTKYGRNRASGVVWRRDEKAHASSLNTQDSFYQYDGLQQVTSYERGNLTPSTPPYTGIVTLQQSQTLAYDQTGNWTNQNTVNPPLTQTRTHNVANEILTFNGIAADPTYNGAGNMTLMPKPINWGTKWYCAWDAWNRLIRINQTTSGGTVVFTAKYDARSRRTQKVESSTTTEIYYDKQWRSVEERIGSTVKAQYTWSPLDRWTLIRRKRSTTGTLNETLWCLRDYLDPVAIIDSSAAVQERYRYDAFGTCDILTSTFVGRASSLFDWNFLFHGEFQDDSQLYNYGYRYYHPNLGRWISRDPIGEEGGLNLYFYSNNNPTNEIDWIGLAVAAQPKPGDLYATLYDAIAAGGIYAEMGSVDNFNRRHANWQKLTREQKVTREEPQWRWEFCGKVCCDSKGSYYFSAAKTDESNGSCDSYAAPPCKDPDKRVGTYHNHPPIEKVAKPVRNIGVSEADIENALNKKFSIGATAGDNQGGYITEIFDPATKTKVRITITPTVVIPSQHQDKLP